VFYNTTKINNIAPLKACRRNMFAKQHFLLARLPAFPTRKPQAVHSFHGAAYSIFPSKLSAAVCPRSVGRSVLMRRFIMTCVNGQRESKANDSRETESVRAEMKNKSLLPAYK